jgi:hypothetical protein
MIFIYKINIQKQRFDMDNKFKTFLELASIYEQPKDAVEKILTFLAPQSSAENKEFIFELFSKNNLEPLCEHVAITIQDKFDDQFTEKELNTLIEVFSNPITRKWLTFYNSIEKDIETSYVEWITSKVEENDLGS